MNFVVRKPSAVFSLCFALALFVFFPHPLPATNHTASDNDLRAAFVFNFARFVDWQENDFTDRNSSFSFCVYNDNDIAVSLDQLKDKTINNRKITVTTFKITNPAKVCHSLYIGKGTGREDIKQILDFFRGKRVLTVSDFNRFSSLGGMIEMYISENRYRFRLNMKATDNSGLRISSNLLKLADIVK